MARTYVEAQREAVAVILIRHGRILRLYRNERHFPWITARIGQASPPTSIAGTFTLSPGECSEVEECEPDTWLDDRDADGSMS